VKFKLPFGVKLDIPPSGKLVMKGGYGDIGVFNSFMSTPSPLKDNVGVAKTYSSLIYTLFELGCICSCALTNWVDSSVLTYIKG